eukprot:COSAG04_NODE_1494_length_6533_cov_5.988343_2_plen_369_part_00
MRRKPVVSHELMPPALHASPRAGGDMSDGAQLARRLREAAEAGDVELVQSLVEEGADINLSNWYGRTGLMAAAQAGEAGVTRALVEARAHVNAQNKTGWTCLMYASVNGHAELVSYLIRSAACDTHLRDSRGRTARQMAKDEHTQSVFPDSGDAEGDGESGEALPAIDDGEERDASSSSSGWGSAEGHGSDRGDDEGEGEGEGEVQRDVESVQGQDEDEDDDEDEDEDEDAMHDATDGGLALDTPPLSRGRGTVSRLTAPDVDADDAHEAGVRQVRRHGRARLAALEDKFAAERERTTCARAPNRGSRRRADPPLTRTGGWRRSWRGRARELQSSRQQSRSSPPQSRPCKAAPRAHKIRGRVANYSKD